MNGYTSDQVDQGREHVKVTQRAVFTQNVYITVYISGIYPVYTRHCAPAAHFLARFVSQPLLAASDMAALRIWTQTGRQCEVGGARMPTATC